MKRWNGVLGEAFDSNPVVFIVLLVFTLIAIDIYSKVSKLSKGKLLI